MNRVIVFFVSVVVIGILSAWQVKEGASGNWLNLWPISAGMIGFIVFGSGEWKKNTPYFFFGALALSLEVLRGYYPDHKVFLNGALFILFLVVLGFLVKNPWPKMGLTTKGLAAKNILLALLFGFAPHVTTYLILLLINPDVLTSNPSWKYQENFLIGIISMCSAFSILLLNNLIGEEAGWRGAFLNGIKGKFNKHQFVWLNVLLFSLWHLPYDVIILKMDMINLGINQVSRILSGLLFLYIFIAFEGSILLVSITHGASNFFIYQVISPKGPFVWNFKGMEGLIYAGLYLGSLLVTFLYARKLAKKNIEDWIKS